MSLACDLPLKGEYFFNSVRFEDKNKNILHIEFFSSTIAFLRPADDANSCFINGKKFFNPDESIVTYNFDKETLEEIYLNLLYMSRCIWQENLSVKRTFFEKQYTFTTKGFMNAYVIDKPLVGTMKIHTIGISAIGPKTQKNKEMYKKGIKNNLECVVLFRFRKEVIEHFLTAIKNTW